MDNYYPRIKDLSEQCFNTFGKYINGLYFRSYRQPEKTLLNLLNKPFLFA